MAMIRAVGGGPAGNVGRELGRGPVAMIGGGSMGLQIVPVGTKGFKTSYFVTLGVGTAENFLRGNNGLGGRIGFVLGYKKGRPFRWILSAHISLGNVIVRLEKEHDPQMPVGIVPISTSCSAHIGESVMFPARTLPVNRFTHDVEFSGAQLFNALRVSSEKSLEFCVDLTLYGMDSLFLGQGSISRANGYAQVLAHGHRTDWRVLTGPDFDYAKERLVHSNILGAKSTYFDRLRNSPLMEGSSRTLRLSDISLEALDILLKYLYTDKIVGNWKDMDNAKNLIDASEKYDLPELKAFYDCNLVHLVTPENVNVLIHICEMFNLNIARVNIMQFCRQRGILYHSIVNSLY